jgi:hypothetical protein
LDEEACLQNQESLLKTKRSKTKQSLQKEARLIQYQYPLVYLFYVSKIFPVLLALLVSKIIGGGDFSQRSEEDRNSFDIVSRGKAVDMLPRHKFVPNFEFIKGFEGKSRLGCLHCHS